jgi:hypothetical protein
MIRLLLILVIGTVALSTSAQSTTVTNDSLVVRKGPDGALFVLWKAGPGESVWTVCSLTGTSRSEIERMNPILKFRNVEDGDLLIAPLDRSLVGISPRSSGHRHALWYQVQPGDTVFSIARRTFDIPIDHLMELNGLQDVALREGQALQIGWLAEPVKPLAESEKKITPDTWYYVGTSLDSVLASDGLDSHKYATQKGVAWWNKSKPDGNFFALHRLAPLNSYIEITNPMFGRSVRAKVIGTIPPTYPEDISVIVSEGVARKLGAIDTRFYAEMSYALD